MIHTSIAISNFRGQKHSAAYIVYPAATISLPGLRTSSMLPVESGLYSEVNVHPNRNAQLSSYNSIDSKYGADIHSGVNVAAAV